MQRDEAARPRIVATRDNCCEPPVSADDSAVMSPEASDPAAHDLEQILWSLSLTSAERLEVLQDFVDAFWTPAHG
jgi:hypothetical protein